MNPDQTGEDTTLTPETPVVEAPEVDPATATGTEVPGANDAFNAPHPDAPAE